MWQSVKILNVFNTLTLKQIFRKTENFFEQLDYKFLVERTKIESASFPYKTAISEANVRTNRMVSPKWTYHKEWSFAINFFNFWKLCSVEGALINSWSDAPTIQMPMFVLFVSAEVLFDGAFSLWVCEYSWLLLLIEDYWCIKRNHLDHFLTKSCSLSNK